MTKEQLEAAIAFAGKTAVDVHEVYKIGIDAAFEKILGCAMFVEWGSDEGSEEVPFPDEAPGVSDDDIPF